MHASHVQITSTANYYNTTNFAFSPINLTHPFNLLLFTHYGISVNDSDSVLPGRCRVRVCITLSHTRDVKMVLTAAMQARDTNSKSRENTLASKTD